MARLNAPWPDRYQGAISLTFDDGMASQLAIAAPMLTQFSIQGTFYLNPLDGFEQTMSAWCAVATAGHELGNHTIRHPCSNNHAFISEVGRLALETMSLDEMEQEILETGRRISHLAPQQQFTSFAYPCYLEYLGQGANRQSYVPLVTQHCIAGRGRGEYANDPQRCDIGYLWSWQCERMSGAELVGLAEEAAAQGRWGIMTFHGIQEGHLSITDRDLETLCIHLNRNQDRIWTAPVATIAQQLSAWRMKSNVEL